MFFWILKKNVKKRKKRTCRPIYSTCSFTGHLIAQILP